jgi:hypothetical protein
MGLEGGGVLLLSVDDAEVSSLSDALTGARGFHSINSDEGEHLVDLNKVLFMRVLPGEAKSRLGFGGDS